MIGILSPHLDDAAFSLAEHLKHRPGAVIICPFGGIPTDNAGRRKYNRLHAEHEIASKMLEAVPVSGPFLDDVYEGTRDLSGLQEWMYRTVSEWRITDLWSPLGIHHPDHHIVAVSGLLLASNLDIGYCIYEELPYRTLYPEQACPLRTQLEYGELLGAPHHLKFKKAVCEAYASQMGEDIERCLYVPERLWRIK